MERNYSDIIEFPPFPPSDAVTKSAIFYFISTILLIFGEVCCCFGHCTRRKRICTFISGVIFIISGLIMLIGLVIYISTFKGEIGSKLRSRSSFQPAQFTYRYGYSFLLVVSGFMSTEMSGTFAIFLYICWHQRYFQHKEKYRREMTERFQTARALHANEAKVENCAGSIEHALIDVECQVHPYHPSYAFTDALQPLRRFSQTLSCHQIAGNHTSSVVKNSMRPTKSQHEIYPDAPSHPSRSMQTFTSRRFPSTGPGHEDNRHYYLPNSVTMSTTADITGEFSGGSGNVSACSTLKRNQSTNTPCENHPSMRKIGSVDRATSTLDRPFHSRSTSVDSPSESHYISAEERYYSIRPRGTKSEKSTVV